MNKTVPFVAFLLVGCGTLRGGANTSEKFPKIQDKACFEAAIRKVPEARFKNHERQAQTAKGAGDEDVTDQTDLYHYEIPALGQDRKDAVVQITERTSPNPKFNSISYANQYGYDKGPDYTAKQDAIAKRVLADVDRAVQVECKLPRLPKESHTY